MSDMQPHPTHRTRAPRAHRDAVPMHASRHTAYDTSHARPTEAKPPEAEMISAQTVFYIARGVAILLAALAIGLGAASNETERPAAAYPTSSHATTR
ncbi:hypothetical protein [Ralstonia insidiosa]|uniref:Transmembrane protein n=1 Tax=Ralstonia insidiosa TaxID=190721 RepID=A0A848NTP3_9RALS|nr:hypothetical protein [Ralstonia insidiosa]NMV36435.1 hypothetical protein [Ralstonia insidiosa]